MADQVRANTKLAKAEGDDEEPTIMDLDFAELDALITIVPAKIEPASLDGGMSSLKSFGLQDDAGLVNQVSDSAVKYARERAAEMVGKRYNAAGELVDSPDAFWRIDEPTRNGIRKLIADGLADNIGRDDIADQILDAYEFSEERATLIANTEVTLANQRGIQDGALAVEASGVEMTKEWYPDDDPCEDCQANADEGEIEMDADFPSGDQCAPAHPRCECTVIYHTKNTTAEETADSEA